MSEEVTDKSPKESFFEVILPFGTDPGLRDTFVNSFGDLRFGKLLEEMDMAAGKIAYAHADGFARDMTIVTAACDRIDLLAPLPADQNLRLRGQVNHVGRSSMEIGLKMDTCEAGEWKRVARAFFIMVALKHDAGCPVHRLRLTDDEERRRYEEGAERSARRREEMQHNWRRSAPTEEEGRLLHELFLKTSTGTYDGLPMRKTWRQTTMIMHPQDRNIHHKIFGGHIMRLSFETAYNVAHLYCRRRPLFVCVDHFDFIKPVEIGSVVSFNGMVTYTGRTSFIVEVTAEVLDPMSGGAEMTNISNWTFVAVDETCRPMPVPRVFPHTYEEGLKHLDGAKRYRVGKRELTERYKDA